MKITYLAQILFTVIHNELCCFVVQNLITCHYSSHLHAYKVDFTDSYSVENCAELVDLHPLSLVSGFGQYSLCNYVVLRHDIIDITSGHE